jgi:hypothetical protein
MGLPFASETLDGAGYLYTLAGWHGEAYLALTRGADLPSTPLPCGVSTAINRHLPSNSVPMDDAIRDLLDVLEAAEAAGMPLTDTDIRERLFAVVDCGFIHEEAGYQVPANLLDGCGGSEVENVQVRAALSAFLARARQYAVARGLNAPEQREAALLGSNVYSSSGATNVSDFFN